MTAAPVRFSEGQLFRVITGERGIDTRPDASPQRCPKLRPGEVSCDGEWHEVGERKKTSGRCPLRLYRSERVRLAEALALCGYSRARDAMAFPVADALEQSIDLSRPLAGLADIPPALTELRRAGWGQGPHAVFYGTPGTVKTHAALVAYFDALWAGCDALWVLPQDLADVGHDLAAFDELTKMRARSRLEGWKRRPLLIIDDLGNYQSRETATAPGSTRAAAVLGELLDNSSRQRIVTSNLDAARMSAHPDIGPRAADRLFADRVIDCAACGGRGEERHGNQVFPCLKCSNGTFRLRALDVCLQGPSQRRGV